ncbi:MAG: hypothetical protein R2726_02980 [Acidimicrobiales bacterium]
MPTDLAPVERVRGGRRRGVAAAVSAGIVVVVAVAVALLGVPRPPSFPSLADDPNPAYVGTVAYVRDDGPDGWCVTVVDASGAPRRDLRCGSGPPPEWIDWTADGMVEVATAATAGGEPQVDVVDPVSGGVVRQTTSGWSKSGSPDDVGPMSSDGAVAEIRRDGERRSVEVREPDGTTRTVLSVEAPTSYDLVDVRWGPDGRWLLVVDGDGRLIVVPRQDGAPAVLADDLFAGWMLRVAVTGAQVANV